MKDLVLPKIDTDALARNYGRFVLVPLENGYGVTIGNALRRVLLSSIPGAAVTSVRIGGVLHEFADVPGAKEDMMQFILNIKKVRFVSHADGEVHLRVNAKGKAEIVAGDIECSSDVEIVNPELPLLTLDSPDTELEIELVVERGRGYSPSEDRERLPIGQIPIDAVFSPITKVNTTVERTRVGQMTDFDRLLLEVWTDGTVRPGDALSQAAEIVMKHLVPVAEMVPEEEIVEEEVQEQPSVSSYVYDTSIDDLDLTVRAYNCLKRQGISKVGEVLDLLEKGEEELLAIRNFGKKSLVELLEKLEARGFLPPEKQQTAAPEAIEVE